MSRPVNSSERMIEAIREVRIIPLFRSGVPGWSIEELTPPECWFYTSDELGPWDWKVDAVREGDIAYGKFLSGKAAFATVEWYRHLMNWRRANPRYRMALGEPFAAKTRSEALMQLLSPIALEAVRENGSMETAELRHLCGERLSDSQAKSMGDNYKALLKPAVKKNVMDSVLQFLEMGTWVIIGDIRRVYRGPNLEYKGWQRSSITTPDELFGTSAQSGAQPFWAANIENDNDSLAVDCTPEESRRILIDHISGFFPEERDSLVKII